MATDVLRSSIHDEYLHVLCDPCRFNGKTSVAMKYCSDCNGHLCPNCVNTHLRISNTKMHNVSYIITRDKRSQNNVSIGLSHKTLNTANNGLVQSTTQKSFEMKCMEHGKPVVSFCHVHDALCCRVCVGTGHRECQLQVSIFLLLAVFITFARFRLKI